MSELDLNKIWDSDREKARNHYESLSDVEKLAKKKSDNVLNKIYRNILVESIASLILVVLIGIAFYEWERLVFWAYSFFIIIVIAFSLRLYLNFSRGIKNVNQKKVVDSLREYVRITGHYIKRLKVYIYYVTPIGYLIGLVFGTIANPGEDTFVEILIRIGIGSAIGIPILALIIWFFNKKYIKWLYGRHYDSLREILENLEREE